MTSLAGVDVELFANDLSIHGQFYDISSFRDALARLMAMRKVARCFGREVHCHRTFASVKPIPDVPMQQVVQRLNKDQARSVMSWITRAGPFWDDLRQHDAGDYLECGGEVVTDSAIGEAAFRTLHSVECELVSVTPSDWDFSPVEVAWRRESEGLDDETATLQNWRDAATLKIRLQDAEPPMQSWDDLRTASMRQFKSLIFAEHCFASIADVPFARCTAERFLVLLGILDRVARAFDADGRRTPEGHRICQDHFTGDNALFSDSSDAEKHDFRTKLTFPHPDDPGKSLFCPWHGKERHMTFRLHFSWPIQSGNLVYVVYAGPKRTKR